MYFYSRKYVSIHENVWFLFTKICFFSLSVYVSRKCVSFHENDEDVRDDSSIGVFFEKSFKNPPPRRLPNLLGAELANFTDSQCNDAGTGPGQSLVVLIVVGRQFVELNE